MDQNYHQRLRAATSRKNQGGALSATTTILFARPATMARPADQRENDTHDNSFGFCLDPINAPSADGTASVIEARTEGGLAAIIASVHCVAVSLLHFKPSPSATQVRNNTLFLTRTKVVVTTPTYVDDEPVESVSWCFPNAEKASAKSVS